MMTQKEATKWLPTEKLDKDEHIVIFLRRHWFVLFSKYLFMALLGLAPIAVYILAKQLFPTSLANESVRAVVGLSVSIYYLFIWLTMYTVFIDYYLDVWIVTNHRIIDREQKGLFHLTVSEQSIKQVQDVSSNMQGILPTLLEYGDVLIQSAAAKNKFQFKQVPEPEIVAMEINKLATEYRKEHPGE